MHRRADRQTDGTLNLFLRPVLGEEIRWRRDKLPTPAAAGRHPPGGDWDEIGPDLYGAAARAKAPQREAVAFKTVLNDVKEEPHGGECQG